MERGRGRGSRGRGNSGRNVSTPKKPAVARRGRGRPPSAASASATISPSPPSATAGGDTSWIKMGNGVVAQTVMRRLEKSFAHEEDDDTVDVECSVCRGGKKLTYRQFRLHNIHYHLNTAVPMNDMEDLVLDHKYFARKLNEFKKLTKVTVFDCPREKCNSSFKSTLGLAYHMNTCGRTAEELDAVLIQCELCDGKFSLPNMQWHRKTHEVRKDLDGEQLKQLSTAAQGRRRTSAINARKSFKRLLTDPKGKSTNRDDEEDESDFSSNTEDDDTSNASPQPAITNKKSQARLDRDCIDYCSLAQNFLETVDCDGRAWDDPVRNIEDSFLHMTDNLFQDELIKDEFESYLPAHRESVEFKYITDDGTSNYHRLTWFEGETAISSSAASQPTLLHSGGPVLSMSWHPSGKLLAVSVGKFWGEEIDILKNQERKSCVQIYSSLPNNLSLQLELIIGVRWGYATNIQWSSFYPDIMDSYNPSENFNDVEVYCRIGYLAIACEDSTIRIMSIRIEDLKLTPNYEYKPGHSVKVYTKTPEICLKVHESVIEDEIGNVTKFDWHEGHRFVAAGYANGMIAVYDVQTKSPFLTETITEANDKVTVVNPFWVFHGHRLPLRGVCFDPVNPRYLVTAGQDRILKIWDMKTRMLRESKRIGICLDMCWIRGWIHQAISVESHVAYQSAMHNYVRVFSIGSSMGKPTSAELSNFTSLDFYHGLTAQGTDDGKVNVTYYDWFWRECDYDRNRKKRNLTVLSTVEVDPKSYTKLSSSDFKVSIKRLKKSIYNSKGYQRLGVQDEEGVYSAMLEARFGGPAIFDEIPTADNAEELGENDQGDHGGEITVENYEIPSNNDQAAAFEDALNAVHQPKQKDRLIPVYDVNIREEEPKVIMSFVKQRPSKPVPTTGMDHSKLEEYVRFQPYIRVNKISWSPNGKIIAVGYRNGLISLLPGEFENIFLTRKGFGGF